MPPYYRVDIWYVSVVLGIGFVFFWLGCKIFRIKRSGIPHLAAIMVAFTLSPFHPIAVVVAALPFIIGFISGHSTKVRIDPTDALSQRIKMSDEEYAHLAEQHHTMLSSIGTQRFFHSPHVHPTQKLSFLFQGFGLYRHARGIALTTSWFYIMVWSTASVTGSSELFFLLFMLSLPFGISMGLLWKYIKGHPGPPKAMIGGRAFRPTVLSFILSSLYSMTPAITAAMVTYFFHEKGGVVLIVLDVLTGLLCLYFILVTIFAHMKKISLLHDGIIISGISRPYGLRWLDVDKATLRERHNFLSGRDRLLVLSSKQGHNIAYPVSVLSNHDQNMILKEVRRRVPTSTVFDNPTV